MREQELQNIIRMKLSDYAVVFRANVGKVKMHDGRWFDTGLPKGFSDLCGFRKTDGKMFFFEVKTERGKLRNEQINFLNAVSKYPVIVGVVRSVDDAIKLITKG